MTKFTPAELAMEIANKIVNRPTNTLPDLIAAAQVLALIDLAEAIRESKR